MHDRGVFGFDVAGFSGLRGSKAGDSARSARAAHREIRAASANRRHSPARGGRCDAARSTPRCASSDRPDDAAERRRAQRRTAPPTSSQAWSPRSIERRSARPSMSMRVLRHVFEVGRRHRADPKAALVGSLHQPVGDQPRQRLAHRGEAHRKLLCQPRDMEFLAGNKPGRKDVGAQTLQHGRGQAPRPAPSLHVKTERNTAPWRAQTGRPKQQSSIENRFFSWPRRCLPDMRKAHLPVARMIENDGCDPAGPTQNHRGDARWRGDRAGGGGQSGRRGDRLHPRVFGQPAVLDEAVAWRCSRAISAWSPTICAVTANPQSRPIPRFTARVTVGPVNSPR